MSKPNSQMVETVYGVKVSMTDVPTDLYNSALIRDTGTSNHVQYLYNSLSENLESYKKLFRIEGTDNASILYESEFGVFKYYGGIIHGHSKQIAGGPEKKIYLLNENHQITSNNVYTNDEMFRITLISLKILYLYNESKLNRLIDKTDMKLYIHSNTYYLDIIKYVDNSYFIKDKTIINTQLDILETLLTLLNPSRITQWKLVFQQKTIADAVNVLYYVNAGLKRLDQSLVYTQTNTKLYVGWENNKTKKALDVKASNSKASFTSILELPAFTEIIATESVKTQGYFASSSEIKVSSLMINDLISVLTHITPFYVHEQVAKTRIHEYMKHIKKTFRKSEVPKQFYYDILLFIQLCAIYLRIYSLRSKVEAMHAKISNHPKSILEIYQTHLNKFSNSLYQFEKQTLSFTDIDRSSYKPKSINVIHTNIAGCMITDIEHSIYKPIIGCITRICNATDPFKSLGVKTYDPQLCDTLLKTLKLAICKSVDKIPIDFIYKDDLDLFIESIAEAFFRKDLKDIIDIIGRVKKLHHQTTYDNEDKIDVYYEFYMKHTANKQITWDVLRSIFESMSDSERDKYRKVAVFFGKNIYISLIELYENLSGSVRVYIKTRDKELTQDTYNNKEDDKNFMLISKTTTGEEWISKNKHVMLMNNSHVVLGTHQCLLNTKNLCKHIQFGPFYRVVPPYSIQNNEYKKLTEEVLANDYLNVDNILQLFEKRDKVLYLTLFTYGYSGSGKTYTLFGEKYEGGIMSVIAKKLGDKMYLNNTYTLTGYIDKGNIIADKIVKLPNQMNVAAVFNNLLESKDSEDSFIKVTTNNPESSRGFLFFEYIIKIGGNSHKLIVVDMAGNEDPLDILIKTLPSYELPIYKDPYRKTFIESQRIVDIEKFSKLTMNAVIANIFYVLKLTYTPLYNLKTASDAAFVQRLLGIKAGEKQLYLNTIDNTIFSILRKVTNNYETGVLEFNKFYDCTKQLKLLVSSLNPLLKNYETNLNYGMYALIFNMIKQMYSELKTNMVLTNDINDSFTNHYTKELERLKIYAKYLHIIDKKGGTDYFNFQVTMQNICDNIINSIKSKTISAFNMFKINKSTTEYSVDINTSNPFVYGILILYEIHKTLLYDVKGYNTVITEDHAKLLSATTDFMDSHFELLTSSSQLEDQKIDNIHYRISNTIDKLYFAIPKNGTVSETLLKSIDKLSAIQYTIDMYMQLKNNPSVITKDENWQNICKFKLSLNETSSKSHTFLPPESTIKSVDLNMKTISEKDNTEQTRDIGKTQILIQDLLDNHRYNDDIRRNLHKLKFSTIFNNQTFQDLFGKLRANIVIHKDDDTSYVYSNEPSYFKRIVMEGYYINQVNYELISLLKYIRENDEIKDTMISPLDKKSISRRVINTDTMYGMYYNTNAHLNRHTDPSDPDFRMTNLYHILGDILNLQAKEIDRKFFMIANIRPDEAKYRPGAINTLQLMQELALPE